MKAVLCKHWGDPSTLVIEDVESPAVPEGHLKIRVRAVGVNYADTLMIAGLYQVKPPFPFSPGLEAAGEVIESASEQFKPGDHVMVICDYGALAEEVTVPASMAIHIPDGMDMTTAAAFPIAYGTSHLALAHRAHLRAGETLVVLGSSGGVGLTAVELGKLMGATVIAAASSPVKLEIPRQYGADHLINYSREDLRDRILEITGGRGADVVYDPVGGDLFAQAMRCMAWEGRLLVIGFASGRIPEIAANIALVKNCSIVGVYWGAYARKDPVTMGSSLQTLIQWHSEGKLNPHISRTYPLDQAPDALQSLISRQSTGKVVVTL